ncbi:MAG: inositol monophosphatase [Alphaproteobacteria bacterium]|nr:inositol monophosphatase [Alphaproteobacteria bacterium]
MTQSSALIHVMDRAARKAGRALVRDFGEVELLQVSKKGAADFVSAADLRAEQTLKEELARARPDFIFEGEETGVGAGSGKTRWLVDPLDGTTNFLHGIPHFAISIAVVEDGKITAGLVYSPLLDEVYSAASGEGAFVGRRRLRVSARSALKESLIATGIPYLGRGDHKHYLSTLECVMGKVAGIRRFGSAALDLAYVAAGRFDGFWEFGLKPWDVAAGIILVREAGGFVTDARGGEDMLGTGDIVAGNGAIHQELRTLLSPLGMPAAA